MADEFLPIAKPDLSDGDIAEVVDTLSSGWLVYGPKTQRFEQQFRDYTGTKHALAVSSCTAGMHLALLACGIGAGDDWRSAPHDDLVLALALAVWRAQAPTVWLA